MGQPGISSVLACMDERRSGNGIAAWDHLDVRRQVIESETMERTRARCLDGPRICGEVHAVRLRGYPRGRLSRVPSQAQPAWFPGGAPLRQRFREGPQTPHLPDRTASGVRPSSPAADSRLASSDGVFGQRFKHRPRTLTKAQGASCDDTRRTLVHRHPVDPGVVRLSEDRCPGRVHGDPWYRLSPATAGKRGEELVVGKRAEQARHTR